MTRHPTVMNRTNYKRMRGMFQKAQKEAQKTSWRKYVFTVNSSTEDAKVWRKVNKIKGKHRPKPPPTLKINGRTVTEPREVAARLAEHYAASSVKTKLLYPVEHKRALLKRRKSLFTKKGGHPDNELLNAPFTLKELETQLG